MDRTGKVRELSFRGGLIVELVLELDDGAILTIEFADHADDVRMPMPLEGRYMPLNGLGLAQVTVSERQGWQQGWR